MKIIYNGIKDNHATQEITCYHCQSILEITVEDLGIVKNDFREGDYYNISCPVCKNLLYISVSSLNKDMKNGGYARSRRKES